MPGSFSFFARDDFDERELYYLLTQIFAYQARLALFFYPRKKRLKIWALDSAEQRCQETILGVCLPRSLVIKSFIILSLISVSPRDDKWLKQQIKNPAHPKSSSLFNPPRNAKISADGLAECVNSVIVPDNGRGLWHFRAIAGRFVASKPGALT